MAKFLIEVPHESEVVTKPFHRNSKIQVKEWATTWPGAARAPLLGARCAGITSRRRSTNSSPARRS